MAGVRHTWVGDLSFQLTSPSGTTVKVIDRPGYGKIGSSAQNMSRLVLDDEADATSIGQMVSSHP